MTIAIWALVAGVIAALVVNMIIGMFWYSEKGFGKAWLKELGVSSAEELGDPKNAMKLAPLPGLVNAIVISVLLVIIGIADPLGGAALAFLCWLGFTFPAKLNEVIFHGNSMKLFAIDAGQLLISSTASGAAIALVHSFGAG